jgi:hypothetical protein
LRVNHVCFLTRDFASPRRPKSREISAGKAPYATLDCIAYWGITTLLGCASARHFDCIIDCINCQIEGIFKYSQSGMIIANHLPQMFARREASPSTEKRGVAHASRDEARKSKG